MRKLRASAFSLTTSRRNLPRLARRFRDRLARLFHLDGEAAEIGQLQLALQQPAIAVRICAHAASAGRSQGLQLANKRAATVEQLLRRIAPHPIFEHFEMRRIFAAIGDRHLMGAPETLDLQPVDLLGAGPALR